MIEVRIPLPPSANNLFANGRRCGRVKTARYRAWIIAAGWELTLQQPRPIKGRYRMEIELPWMRGGRADPSNRVKAIEDLFVAHRLIEDDRQEFCAGIKITSTGKKGLYARIRIEREVEHDAWGERVDG